MMKFFLLSFYFTVLQSFLVSSQSIMPSYIEVAKKFFTNYSYEKEDNYDAIKFAKKKQGWFVHIIDRLRNDSIKNQQLFWSLNEKNYRPLKGFKQGYSKNEVEKKIIELLRSEDTPFLYGYERCRYYGYNEWDADIIKDFGSKIPDDDTLLEGLARAYAAYAERYLWHGLGGHPYDNDPLKTKLGKLDIPNRNRVDKFIYFINKSADCYGNLAKRNPGFKMLVGNPKMKLLNEQFHQYQQLLMCNLELEASRIIDKIESNDSIYRKMGHTYLNACPPNSILITYGDNDTYGPWYVQIKEGFRKDVTILNYNLLSFAPYAIMLKKKYASLFSTNLVEFGRVNFDYFVFSEDSLESGEITSPLGTFLENLKKKKFIYPTIIDTLISYKTKQIKLEIDIDSLKKICNQNNFTSAVDIELGDYLLLSDFMILDILNTNIYSRPICFTAQLNLISKNYMQQEGSLYRFLPLMDDPIAKIKIEVSNIEKYLKSNYSPPIVSYGNKNSHHEDVLRGLHSKLFSDLINNYIALSDSVAAKEWAKKYLTYTETKKTQPSLYNLQMAETLLMTGHKTEATVLIEKIAKNLLDTYKKYSAIEYYSSREELLQSLDYLKDLLFRKNITSKALEKIIADIPEQD